VVPVIDGCGSLLRRLSLHSFFCSSRLTPKKHRATRDESLFRYSLFLFGSFSIAAFHLQKTTTLAALSAAAAASLLLLLPPPPPH